MKRTKAFLIHHQQVCASHEVLRKEMLTLPRLVSVADDSSSGSPDYRSDRDYAYAECDLAYTHKRNEELRGQTDVKQFFAKLSTIKSLLDPETRDFLGLLSCDMNGKFIPLFENSEDIDGVQEDYQLLPNHSGLVSGMSAEDPDVDFYCLSCVENNELEKRRLFLPLGGLFVNAENGNRFNERINSRGPRVTRWTGYEVMVSDDLALWIVFDGHSLASEDKAWYPVSCSLTESIKPPSGFACLLPSLTELEHATFEDAKNLVDGTHLPGEMRLEEVEKSEVKERERDQTSTSSPQVHSINKGKQRAENTATGDVQTVHPPWSGTPSDTTGANQDIRLVGQREHTTTPRTMVSVHSPDSGDNDAEMTQVRSRSSSSDAENARTTKLQLDKSAMQDQAEGWFKLPAFEQSLASALEAQLQRLKSFRPGKKSGSSEVENLFTKNEIRAALSYALRESRNPRRHSSQPDLSTRSMEDASKLLYQHR